jgi:hypothetical protein
MSLAAWTDQRVSGRGLCVWQLEHEVAHMRRPIAKVCKVDDRDERVVRGHGGVLALESRGQVVSMMCCCLRSGRWLEQYR